MANTVNVSIIDTANTFNHWRIRDNLIANDVNEIVRGDFTKPVGNVSITEGRLTLANSSGGVLLDVKDDARIDNLLSVDTIESDADGHVYLAAGDITMGNRADGGLFQANINTNFNSAYVAFSNDTVGLINVNTRNVIVNTANTLLQNSDPDSLVTIDVANTFLIGTNVTVSNTSTGSLNIDNRLVKISAPNVILTNTHSSATFNVLPNTYFLGGTVNVANTSSTAVVNIAPNTFLFKNVTISGTTNVLSNVHLTGNSLNVSGNIIHTGATANLSGNLNVTGTTNIASNLHVTGTTANISGNLIVTGTTNVTSNVIVQGTMNVNSNARFAGVTTNSAGTSRLRRTRTTSKVNLSAPSVSPLACGSGVTATLTKR
jgi:hypothetical protein